MQDRGVRPRSRRIGCHSSKGDAHWMADQVFTVVPAEKNLFILPWVSIGGGQLLGHAGWLSTRAEAFIGKLLGHGGVAATYLYW